ncbi:IclR family transcriptional regulator [Streptomyces filamentosus]|uniref:IclR family transcriptional regulator n=1 Tax=Streptomyces filamentosus TaxID=67294 RepID=UPI00123BE5DC|nr:IclR family transcriptional regulator C-terminal domain-containing protein [Streptomyces filamentosus]KAA6219911.1 IclR-family transcriptional regulator [Streptomyces filamentosus]
MADGAGGSVAGRLLSVLDAFGDGGPVALRLTDIAARTGLPAPTALRLVRELVAWGGLERGADGRYRLGLRLRVLGAAAPCPRGLLDAALPALRALGARTGGHADLAVRSAPPSGGVLCLVSGERPPPHATAYGQVLLAAPPVERPRFTRHTVVAPGALAGRLARVRAAGLAVCAEEFRLGEVSVAAPVRGPAGTVAALGVTVPTGVPLDRVAAAVREAARRVRPPEPPPS